MRRADLPSLPPGSRCNGLELLVMFLATTGIALGQSPVQTLQTEEHSSTIRGTVVNAVTRTPISRAQVFSPDERFATLTDGEGHFEFVLPKSTGGENRATESQPTANIPIGLVARKPGYLEDPNAGSHAEASVGSDVTISLLPEGLIQGRIVSSESDPAFGMNVELYSRQVQDGTLRWLQAGSARVNSNGEFRFAELQPGAYKLVTNEAMDNDPVTTIPGGQQYGFPPVFYPGVSDFAAATAIQVAAGQTVQADIPLMRQPYYPVKIPVGNSEVANGFNVTVSVQGHRGPGYSLAFDPEHQSIEGLLPRGSYEVEATNFGMSLVSGAVRLSVSGGPAEGPVLTLTPSSSIPVHVTEEFTSKGEQGSATWNVGGRNIPVRGPRVYLQVNAEPVDDFGQRNMPMLRPPTTPSEDALVLENIAPGRYWLRLHTSRGYVAAASMGGLDLLHQPFTVTSGSSSPIDITMRDDTAELEGTVAGVGTQGGFGSPDSPQRGPGGSITGPRFLSPQAWIYCIPLPDSPGEFQQLWVSPEGKFISPNMAPGAYRIIAFKTQHMNLPYHDAEAMRPYESAGQVIHLSAGQKVSVQLQVASE